MNLWEQADVSQLDCDDIEDLHADWDDAFKSNLEIRYNKLREFVETLNDSTDEDNIEITDKDKDKFKHGTIELVANQIYDKLTILFNNTRKKLGIQDVKPIDPLRRYDWDMCRLGVTKLKSMGFMNIMDEDVQPYRPKYVKAREKVGKLNENLNVRSKAIESSSTTDAEDIEMIEVTSKDIHTTIKDVEQDTSFIEYSERDKLLPLRELEGLDRQLRTIKGSLKVAIAERVDLKARIEHEEKKLNEIQDPTYSDDQRNVIQDRIRKLRGELTERNKEIDILKGEASEQINQIRESITKFLDKETGTLGDRIRTLFKEQGMTIVSILTAIGMAIGVLIEALLGGPSVPTTTTSGSTIGDARKGGGTREWIKNKLKALSRLLGKLADKALASLPGIIGAIFSWILNRAKEVIGWLSQNLWALITGVRVLVYTYFMTKTRRR